MADQLFYNQHAANRRNFITTVLQEPRRQDPIYKRVIIGLLLLSCATLGVTVWIMVDFLREQTVVDGLLKTLPQDAKDSAEFLAGKLLWQFRLITLVVLNLIVTAIAVILLWRAYHASQASLRNVRALASDVLSSMQQAVITTDLRGVVTSINKRGLEFLNVNSNCVGQSIDDLVPKSLQRYRQAWLQNTTEGSSHEYAIEKNGASQTLLANFQALTDGHSDEIGVVIQLSDTTEKKLIEDRMRRMERYMGLGSLAGGLHHEIKNPLAALSLHVQLLEEQLETNQPSDEVMSMLTVIRSEVSRIGGVLEGFRNFASIGQLQTSDVNLRELIQRQIDFIHPQAEKQGVKIELKDCDPALFITVDQGRVEQVMLNLFINAIEAMPKGGNISVSAQQDGSAVKLIIADSGIGIPEKFSDKVLDPYFTTKSTGTGLGLALCDKIMRQHNGAIDFKASESGTTFYLTFPVLEKVH